MKAFLQDFEFLRLLRKNKTATLTSVSYQAASFYCPYVVRIMLITNQTIRNNSCEDENYRDRLQIFSLLVLTEFKRIN